MMIFYLESKERFFSILNCELCYCKVVKETLFVSSFPPDKYPSVEIIASMYQSVSETRHPLQTEEQEVGIDPLQSYLNKTEEGEFCISVGMFYFNFIPTNIMCRDDYTCHNLFNFLNEVDKKT